ncbi:MAG: glycoside hydrolase family 2 protein, partial [Acidobacteria bacterium]|nr:glycoside hydrolase family 2 protein [Acidobacteriota bacterium]
FSAEAIRNYVARFDRAFAGHDVAGVRAFFNDSYEVDDARGQADWTPRLFEEFVARRGYDLRAHLPALFGKDTDERNSRVLADYRQTVSDLILDTFTTEWRNWAHRRGAIVRNQAHGSPANILDLYGTSDIPEMEGTDLLRIKFASSAAHVTGKRLASAEAATWLNDHFLSSLADVRKAVDRYFLGGVNHIVYHGTAYSPRSEPWPGWLFYAAVHFQPTNPFWADFTALNSYVTRVQSFLQGGTSDADVMLYFPVDDFFAERGTSTLVHFDGGGPLIAKSPFGAVAETLQRRGYAFDYVSDRQLQQVASSGATLRSGGASYGAVVVPDCRLMPLETFEMLVNLARGGAAVIAINHLPGDVPGVGQLDRRREAFRRLTASLSFVEVAPGLHETRLGRGVFLLGADVDVLLARAGVRRETMVDAGLQFVRRAQPNGFDYFIANWTERPFDGWLPLAKPAKAAALFDPMSGQRGYARVRSGSTGAAEVRLQLQPGASCVVRTLPAAGGAGFPYLTATAQPQLITGTWTVRFVNGGPELPPEARTTDLGSWTELGGKEVRRFSGTASYTISFGRPAEGTAGWILDLGRVCESARVRLNGRDLGVLIGPNYRVFVDRSLVREANVLEISVSNLMANRIADMDRRGVVWKKFYNVNFPANRAENRNANGLFDASKWVPRESGLLGPVTLTPVAREKSWPRPIAAARTRSITPAPGRADRPC